MILMLAPAPKITFGAMPSGVSYTADQYGLVYVLNDSAADQAALQTAGCYTLTPFGGWGNFGFLTLADLYAADTGSILPGRTGYPEYTVASVFQDGTTANDGTWVKSGTGNGSGNWTQISTQTLANIVAAVATETTRAETAEGSLSTAASSGISTNASGIGSLSTSASTGLSTAQGNQNSLSTGLSSAKSSVGSLSTSASAGISSNQSGVVSLSTALSSANSGVNSLSTSASTGISTNASNVGVLSTSVSAVQASAPLPIPGKQTVITDSSGYAAVILEDHGYITSLYGQELPGVGFLEAKTDANGWAVQYTRADGTIVTAPNAGQLPTYLPSSAFGLVECDPAGWAQRVTTAAGLDWPDKSSNCVPGTKIPTSKVALLGGLCHVLSYGQSLSVGAEGLSLVTVAPIANVYKFSGGVRPFDAGTNPSTEYASLVPFVETVSSPYGQTPCGGHAQVFVELLSAENAGRTLAAFGQNLMFSAVGNTGTPISLLIEGGPNWFRVNEALEYARTLAQGMGLTYAPGPMDWTQVEADIQLGTPTETYISDLISVRNSYERHAQTIAGDSQMRPLITYQCAAHAYYNAQPDLPIAISDFCETSDLFICAGPTYQLPYNANDVHMTGAGYEMLGAMYGRAHKRLAVDGVKFRPLRIIGAVSQGGLIRLQFRVPVAPLVLDTSVVTNPGNYGFDLWEADGVTSLSSTITSVAITGPTEVTIKTSYSDTSPLPQGFQISYARTTPNAGVSPNGPGNGPTTGARGCLRDSDPFTVTDPTSGTVYALHNYCLMFNHLEPG